MLARMFARCATDVKIKAYSQSYYSSGLWVKYMKRHTCTIQQCFQGAVGSAEIVQLGMQIRIMFEIRISKKNFAMDPDKPEHLDFFGKLLEFASFAIYLKNKCMF